MGTLLHSESRIFAFRDRYGRRGKATAPAMTPGPSVIPLRLRMLVVRRQAIWRPRDRQVGQSCSGGGDQRDEHDADPLKAGIGGTRSGVGNRPWRRGSVAIVGSVAQVGRAGMVHLRQPHLVGRGQLLLRGQLLVEMRQNCGAIAGGAGPPANALGTIAMVARPMMSRRVSRRGAVMFVLLGLGCGDATCI